MQDPIDDGWALVFCENLGDELKSSQVLVPAELGYLCQNTPAGERLLELRKWKCGERTDAACICGGKRGTDFYDVYWHLSKFYGGKLVNRETGVIATLCYVSVDEYRR